MIGRDDRAILQDRLVTKALCTLLRAEMSKGKVEAFMRCLDIVELLPIVGDKSAGIQAELNDFKTILWPWRAETTVPELTAAQSKFETTKTLRLWRPLYLFATGKDITTEVGTAIKQRNEDVRLAAQLTELQEEVEKFEALSEKNLVDEAGAPSAVPFSEPLGVGTS
eukprot:10171778-Lingulodinium_polyedra.AAC.1